jgi:hypothetical protein
MHVRSVDACELATVTAATPASRPSHNYCVTFMLQFSIAGRRLHFRRTRRGNVNCTGPLSGPIALVADI